MSYTEKDSCHPERSEASPIKSREFFAFAQSARNKNNSMFETLTGQLNQIFDGLRRRGKLSEADVDAAMREVRLALLEADVHFSVVKTFIAKVA